MTNIMELSFAELDQVGGGDFTSSDMRDVAAAATTVAGGAALLGAEPVAAGALAVAATAVTLAVVMDIFSN